MSTVPPLYLKWGVEPNKKKIYIKNLHGPLSFPLHLSLWPVVNFPLSLAIKIIENYKIIREKTITFLFCPKPVSKKIKQKFFAPDATCFNPAPG
jgi:hypothetical protein